MGSHTPNEQLADRAWKGDSAALETALKEADRHRYENVETVLLNSISLGSGPPYSDVTDFLAMKMIMLRQELAPSGASRAERLLAEQATICWLHLELLNYEAARLFNGRDIECRRADIIERRLAQVQDRFARALMALAKIRRLNLPLVINQVNVGAQVNGVQMTGQHDIALGVTPTARIAEHSRARD
jgi:hypothetical protein